LLSLLLILVLLITAGCSATIPLRTAEDMDFTINRKSTITTVDNQKYLGQYVVVKPDSTSWIQLESRQKTTHPTCEIRELRAVDTGNKTTEGILMGGAGGIAGGFFLISLSDQPRGATSAGLIFLPILGLLGGMIFGAKIGSSSDDTYIFVHGPQDEHLVKEFKPAPPADRVR
jgi:hypothetical protein